MEAAIDTLGNICPFKASLCDIVIRSFEDFKLQMLVKTSFRLPCYNNKV